MKKAWRTLAGVIAAIAMAVAGLLGVGTAYAANETYTITAPSNGHTYEVYQIFTGDYSERVLSNVKWGKNGTSTEGQPVDDKIISALTAVSGKSDAEKLAVIEQYAKLDANKKYNTISSGGSIQVPGGYYLIKDVDGELAGDDDAYTLYVVQVVGDVTITPKSGVPESQKKVKDTNDTASTTSDWQDSADYDIGDRVPFQLTATIGVRYADYKVYKLTFHDTQSDGLTFNADSVKVYVDNDGSTSQDPIVNSDNQYYEVVTSELDDSCTFEIRFADLKKIDSVRTGSVIRVEYESTLNNQAVIGSTGNPNTMHIEFSNNPNDETGGETGKTPDDKVIVFTYQTVINKVDSENTPLTGAQFTLEKYSNGEWIASATATFNSEGTEFTFKGLDDGTYRLTETTTPAGYNTIDPIVFTITAEHDVTSDNPALTRLNGNAVTGRINFTGDKVAGSLTADVVNNKGSELPETGGMGTVWLYAGGAAIVLLAVIGLAVTARRRNGTR